MHTQARILLLASALALTSAAGAHAQTVTDPTDLHMGTAGQTGSDPVLLNNSTTFGVTNVPSGQNQDAYNLELILAVPVFGGAFTTPTIGTLSTTMAGVMATAGTMIDVTMADQGGVELFGTGSTIKDLYSYVGCTVCDNSLNQTNMEGTTMPPGPFQSLFTAGQLATLDGFEVFTVPITFSNTNNDLLAQQTLTTAGDILGLGTYVAALAYESDLQTPLATSFTNTGLVNTMRSHVAVPEPASIAIFGSALLGLAGVARRRRKS